MIEADKTTPKKHNYLIRWALRLLVGFSSLIIILSLTVQIPFIQKYLLDYATDYVTTNFGVSVEIESVELHPLRGDFSLNRVEYFTAEIEIDLESIILNLGIGEGWDILLKSVELDGVSYKAESVEAFNSLIQSINSSENLSTENGQTTFIEHFELSNFEWVIGDSLNGEVELISLDSIVVTPSSQGREAEIIIGKFDVAVLKTEFVLEGRRNEPKREFFTVIKSLGRLSVLGDVIRVQVEKFDSKGIEFSGNIEFDLKENTEGTSEVLTFIPALDIEFTVQPSVYAKWGGDSFYELSSHMKNDEVKGKVVIKDGIARLENIANSQFLISGELNEREERWVLNVNFETDIVKPLLDELNINNESLEAYINDIKTIRFTGSGDLNNAKGEFSFNSQIYNGITANIPKLTVGYDLNIEDGNWRNGVSCEIIVDSLSGKYGIIKDLNGTIEVKDDVAEFRWDNELLNAHVYSNELELFSHLNGYSLIEFGAKGKTKFKARLNLRNSVIMGGNHAPINFERFDLSVEMKESELLEFEIESDLIIGEGVVSLESDVWTKWIEKTISREETEKDEIKVAAVLKRDKLLTRGHCKILRAKPLATIIGIPASASTGTDLNWLITNGSSEVKAHADWLVYNEFVLNGVTLNVDGETEENWINIEVLYILNHDNIISSDFNIDVHADSVWTTDVGWRNNEGVEGFVRIEGSLEKEAMWSFNVYEATIPLGLDTIELTRIPSPLVISETEISSEGMSWKGGGFRAEIDGKIGGDNDQPLNFNVHTDNIDSSRTKSWFNVPVSADKISLFGSLGGTLLNPSLTFSGVGEGIAYGGETIPSSVFKVTYFEDELQIDLSFSGFGDEGSGEITTSGSINHIRSGNYTLDLISSVIDFPLSWANTILNEKTAKLGGQLDANLTVMGKLTSPAILGSGTLKNALVGIAYLGTQYDVTGDFGITPYGIELNGLQVRDGKGGEGFLVGTALHESFKKWNLDISLSIENEDAPLEIMNIPKSPDAYFYGTGNAWGDVNIFGYEDQITIEARVKTTQGTEFVLPMDAASNSTWSSFVNIVNHDDNVNDHSDFDSSENDSKTSIKLDLIIDVTDESIARIVFDEVVGDEIIGRCKGVIHIAIDDFERLAMFGSLEVVEGEYLFTLSNFINKKFIAEPGGTIKWFGDPYKAEIDLQTYYTTRTSLRPISPEILDNTKQRVDLILEMDGDLLRPGIKFDIRLPEGDARTRASLASLIANEEEMNRQAISLLVLQQFLPAQWQAAAIGSTGLQENSTELISAQLGNWLSGMSDDLNIGIDYDASNNIGDEAALAVALSTQLLNDRLHIEGEVGTQHLNSGSIEDLQVRDFRLRYDIKDDGSLQLTGYSTQRATIPGLEGESVQGVGIVFHRNFESFRDLFKRQEK